MGVGAIAAQAIWILESLVGLVGHWPPWYAAMVAI
jgi:hypothetical protein